MTFSPTRTPRTLRALPATTPTTRRTKKATRRCPRWPERPTRSRCSEVPNKCDEDKQRCYEPFLNFTLFIQKGKTKYKKIYIFYRKTTVNNTPRERASELAVIERDLKKWIAHAFVTYIYCYLHTHTKLYRHQQQKLWKSNNSKVYFAYPQ
uniref:(northern house mosquito) hypothetical protein n=1 Tax=Culex pipiens TaxID=7175 RepID=A0A8D8B041_CULPI